MGSSGVVQLTTLPTGAQLEIGDREFDELRALIRCEAGIALSDAKRQLVHLLRGWGIR